MNSRVIVIYLIILCPSTGYCLGMKFYSLFVDNPDFEKLKKSLKEDPKLWSNEFNVETENILPYSLHDISNVTVWNGTHFLEPIAKNWSVRYFYLFTRDFRKGTQYELLDPRNVTSIQSSHFQTRTTYVIIHGFIGFGLESWILSLKDILLAREDCNVISVDWPAGTTWFLPSYVPAANRVPYVGNDTALLLYNLVTYKGLLLTQVHCIGHSLGGHVCGFMGKPFQGRVGRISGLDPAGPFFHGLNSSRRLDKKDAVFVDVVHTNACQWDYWMDCYGLNENIGHSNFFPNGGEHQPACATIFVGNLGGAVGCDHEMAYMYYTESLSYGLDSTYFFARPCNSWYNYISGNCSCGKNPQFMGYNVNTELDGEFYLKTRAYPPYADDDPECSGRRKWNILVIIGYILTASIVLPCVLTSVVIMVKNVCRCLRGNRNDSNDDDPLVNGTEDEDEPSEESGVEDGPESDEEAQLSISTVAVTKNDTEDRGS